MPTLSKIFRPVTRNTLIFLFGLVGENGKIVIIFLRICLNMYFGCLNAPPLIDGTFKDTQHMLMLVSMHSYLKTCGNQ